MRMHLLSLDPSYINCIEKGPHVPVKINTALRLDGSEREDVEVPKNRSEFTEEDEKEVQKDNKAMNILFNGIDDDMFDSVINCPTAKEVWDTIQTLCEGTDQLYGRVYMVKDSNIKFLRALPRDWKPMIVALRQPRNFNEYSLDKLYGILKTYELEIQQDEELEKSSKKEKTVALVAEKEEEEEKALKSVAKTSNNITGEGKNEAGKNKGKAIEENEEPTAQDELDELDGHLVFLARKLYKLKFKRNATSSRPFNRGNQSKPSGMVDRSKFKCFNCGLPGHFFNECRRPASEKKGSSSKNVDYRRKYFDLLKQNKETTFITEDGDWAADEGDSNNEEHVNLALMAIGDEVDSSITSGGQASELAKDELLTVLKREEILKKQLEREQEIIAKWKDSRNVLENMCSTHVLEESCKNSWKMNKKLLEESDVLLDNDHPLTDIPSTDENYPSKNQIAVDEDQLKKLDKKYGPINKNFVKESGSSKKIEKEGIGHSAEKMEAEKERKKSSRNGKVGNNKRNDYTPDKNAVRKTCSKCGSVNHLAINCKNALSNHCMPNPMINAHLPYMHMFPNAPIHYANMQFMPNPYFGAFNMHIMPVHHDNMNHAFINHLSGHSTNVASSNSAMIPKVKKSVSEDEVVSKPSKSKENKSSKPKGSRKNLWYLDSGCSRHMTGDSTLLSKFEERAGPSITFGDDNKGFTLGYGLISKGNFIIDNVALVKGLQHNFLSISQLCDRGHQVWFSTKACVISDKKDNKVVLTGNRKGNVYITDFNSTSADSLTCLFSKASLDDNWLWHKKLSYLNFKTMNDLVRKDLKKYCLVIVVDFTKFTWTYFLHAKDESSEIIINHIKIVDNIDPIRKVSRIRSDNGTEFKNSTIKDFCEEKGIHHEFSAARTPQQNGVVERKNRTLIEAARTMLEESKLPTYFWAEAVNTTCYTQNISLINQALTPYQLFKGKKPTLNFLHVFGCKCFVLRNQGENLGKFEAKADEGIFVGYAAGKAYRVYNLRLNIVIESVHVMFDDKKIQGLDDEGFHDVLQFENETEGVIDIESDDDDCAEHLNSSEISSSIGNNVSSARTAVDVPQSTSMANDLSSTSSSMANSSRSRHLGGASQNESDFTNEASSSRSNLPPQKKWTRDHPFELIIGDAAAGVKTRRATMDECLYNSFLSQEEPKKVEETLLDPDWILATQEELNQFERNKVWKLVPAKR
ncbi:uncharacterized protein LOC135152795 [Daucus carota subsp. sativus]|uniref:uncharacterized protein LOC135152795 n=1 Tax=Daucus carota subsp. sativus TaxID=79200 RepID=UPI003082D456